MSDGQVLSVAVWDYDRTMSLIDGRIPIRGCTPQFSILKPQEIFVRAFGDAEFDVSELSLSRYVQSVVRGDNQYIAIPVFLSRTFRHSVIYVRSDRITRPEDLKGKRIGLVNYDDTAAVVARGMLRDEYGLGVSDFVWVIGDLDSRHRTTARVPELPKAIHVELAPSGTTLDAMLRDGIIDGVIALAAPSALYDSRHVERLFPKWWAAEAEYFVRTGVFPIMHTVGIRRTLVEADPDLALAFFEAFLTAKEHAVAELKILQAPKVTLPWVVAECVRTEGLMGEDYWPYGLARNRRALETSMRYLAEDGLLAASPKIEELFASGFEAT